MTRSIWNSACTISLLLLASIAHGQEIAWAANLKAAQDQAARDGKLVLVHFYSDHCPPCVALERNVFSRPEVVAAVHLNYVPLKVHVDSAPQLAQRFGVAQWPTDLILTSAGLEVTRSISPKTPAEYVFMLEQEAIQGGVGSGRLAGPSPYVAQRTRSRNDVALAAATAPMQPSNSAPTNTAPTEGSTAPGPADTYDLRIGQSPPVSSVQPRQPPQAYQPAPSSQRQPAGAPGTAASAPNTAAFLQAAARPPAGTTAQPPAPANRAAPSAAPQVPSGRSIYDDYPGQAQTPGVSIYGDQPAMPSGAAAPPPSIYGAAPPNRQEQPRPQTQPPSHVIGQRTIQQPAPQGPAPGQQASAHFRSPQFVEVSKAPPAAIDGFCPVTILESKKWQKGNVRFGAVHLGRTYLFASEFAQKRFLADPLRYAPVLSGCDPVVFAETSQWIDGNHNIGVLHGGKTYFFTSEETRRRFELSPHVYIARVQQANVGGTSRTR